MPVSGHEYMFDQVENNEMYWIAETNAREGKGLQAGEKRKGQWKGGQRVDKGWTRGASEEMDWWPEMLVHWLVRESLSPLELKIDGGGEYEQEEEGGCRRRVKEVDSLGRRDIAEYFLLFSHWPWF